MVDRTLDVDSRVRIVHSGDSTFDAIALDADVMMLSFSRREVRLGRVGAALDALYKLNDRKAPFEKWRSKVRVRFSGLESRHPWESEEARSFFRAVTAHWPFWLHFSTLDDDGIGQVGKLLCTDEIRVSGLLARDPQRVTQVRERLKQADSQLHRSMGVELPGDAAVDGLLGKLLADRRAA